MTTQIEKNKKSVIDFYTRLFNDKDLTAIDTYMGPRYIQHNPQTPDGIEGLRGALQYVFANFPKLHVDIKRVIAEGDLVVLHGHLRMKPEDRGMAVVDILRVQDGRVVEHWDVLQDVPEQTANSNGMF